MAMFNLDLNPTQKTLKSFGFIGLVAFPLFALFSWKQWALFAYLGSWHMAVAYICCGLAAYCVIGAVAAPTILKPLYVGMSVIGYPIGLVVSTLLMGIVYFLVITPVAIVFKLIGRDALHRKFDPAAATYWVPRKPPASVKRYYRQF